MSASGYGNGMWLVHRVAYALSVEIEPQELTPAIYPGAATPTTTGTPWNVGAPAETMGGFCPPVSLRKDNMANPEKFLRTWTFDKSNPIVRFYLWLYEADPTKISFCKLFWALLTSPIVLLVVALLRPFEGLATHLDKKPKSLDPPAPRPKKSHSFAKKVASAVPHGFTWFFDKVAAGFQRFAPVVERIEVWALGYHETVFLIVWVVLAGAAVLTGLGFGAYFIYLYWSTHIFLLVLMYLGIIVGGAAAYAGLLYILGAWCNKHAPSIERFFKTIGRGIKVGWHGLVVFGRFVGTAYYTVKYRTCPRVVVTGLEPKEAQQSIA